MSFLTTVVALALDGFGEHAAEDARVPVVVAPQLLARDREALVGAAVDLADDDFLRHVDETPREVTGVRGAERRVGQTLTGTVRRDEVLEDGQTFTEVRLDRPRDDLALRVGDETAHTGELTDLLDVPSGAGLRHHVDRVQRPEVLLHRLRDLVRRLHPDLDELLTALVVGEQTTRVLRLDLLRFLLVPVEDRRLGRRDGDVVEREGDAGLRRPPERQRLDAGRARSDMTVES